VRGLGLFYHRKILTDLRLASWRLPYGRAGILNFFLQIIASREFDDDDVLLHALRLVGNSCADTDENRALVVKDNYTAAILSRLSPELVHVVIPVIYNICIDYGWYIFQSQAMGSNVQQNQPKVNWLRTT
jgi:hypothetical protein